MTTKNIILSLFFFGMVFAADSPLFIFKPPEDLKNFNPDEVKYEIYEDGEVEKKPKVSGRFTKNGLFKSGKKYKIDNVDFSENNYRIKFIYTQDNINYGAIVPLNLKKEFFLGKYREKASKLNEKNLPSDIEFDMGKNDGNVYPYKFKVNLKKLRTILRGHVVTSDEEEEEMDVVGARITLNSDTKRFVSDLKTEPWAFTDEFGKFEYKILMKGKIDFTPGIVITKNGYHVTEQNYSTQDFNDALITESRTIRIEQRDGRGSWQDCEYPLDYSKECDECICIDNNKKWYPKEGVCDIYDTSCKSNEYFIFLNEFETDSIVYGEMYGECIVKPIIKFVTCPDGSSAKKLEDCIEKKEIDDVLVSITFTKNGSPLQNAKVKYSKYKSKDGSKIILGKTNKNGTVVVNDSKSNIIYQVPFGRYSVDTTLALIGLPDLDHSIYFFLNKKDVRIGSHKFEITDSKGKPYNVIIKNSGKDKAGNTFSLKKNSTAQIIVDFKDTEYTYFFTKNNVKLDITEEVEIEEFEGSSKGVWLNYLNKINENENETMKYDHKWCSDNTAKINSLVQNCQWSELDSFIDKFLDDCIVESDIRLLSNIITYYYHKIKVFDEEKFKYELINDNRSNEMPVFAKLDALHKSYDVLISSIEGDLTNYELAYHYYRKFLFYFYYNEFITIWDDEIQDGIITNRWEYKFGCNKEYPNFRRIGEEGFFGNIHAEAKSALDQFEVIKEKSIGEKIPEFNKLDLMKRNLDVIIMEQKVKDE